MGMWDKDKSMSLPILKDEFENGERFVVLGAGLCEYGIPADKSEPDKLVDAAWLLVGRFASKSADLDSKIVGPLFYVSTIGSATVNNVASAVAADFPVVAEIRMVPSVKGNDARVVKWICDYAGDMESFSPLDLPDVTPATRSGSVTSELGGWQPSFADVA